MPIPTPPDLRCLPCSDSLRVSRWRRRWRRPGPATRQGSRPRGQISASCSIVSPTVLAHPSVRTVLVRSTHPSQFPSSLFPRKKNHANSFGHLPGHDGSRRSGRPDSSCGARHTGGQRHVLCADGGHVRRVGHQEGFSRSQGFGEARQWPPKRRELPVDG